MTQFKQCLFIGMWLWVSNHSCIFKIHLAHWLSYIWIAKQFNLYDIFLHEQSNFAHKIGRESKIKMFFNGVISKSHFWLPLSSYKTIFEKAFQIFLSRRFKFEKKFAWVAKNGNFWTALFRFQPSKGVLARIGNSVDFF